MKIFHRNGKENQYDIHPDGAGSGACPGAGSEPCIDPVEGRTLRPEVHEYPAEWRQGSGEPLIHLPRGERRRFTRLPDIV